MIKFKALDILNDLAFQKIIDIVRKTKNPQYESCIQKDKKHLAKGEKDCCVICLGDFEENSEVCITDCSHMYHESCLSKNQEVNKSYKCPTCREPMKVIKIFDTTNLYQIKIAKAISQIYHWQYVV